MKMKNLIAFAALAFGVVAAPFVTMGADADGHIRSINAMPDASHSIVFPNPDSPLKAGQDVYILIRLLNVNYGENMSDETKVCPWSFVQSKPGATPLTWPKIGLSVGGNIRYAEYSELGPNGESRVNPQFSYYTDLYFKYTVQTGDLGLPIKILQASGKIGEDFGDFMLQNVNMGGVTYNDWNLVCETAFGSGTFESVKFRYGPESPSPAPGGKPNYPAEDEVRTFDFSTEGVYVKAVDFDGNFDDGAGTIWRYVYPGSMTPQVVTYQPKIVGTGDGDENSTVYLWSGDETVFTPWPESGDESEIITVDGRKVLRVTILKGESEARFLLKGGTAAVGSTATIYMSPTTTAGQSAVGEDLAGATVTRTIALKDPPPPTVKFEVIPETVDCKTNYEVYAAQLMVKIEPTADHDVKVKINASLDGTGDLSQIYDANLLGISTTTTGASYEDRETEVTVPANTPAVPLYLYTLGWNSKTTSKGIKFTPSTDDTSVEVKETPVTLFMRKSTPTITGVDPSEATVKPGRSTTFTVTLSDCYMNLMGAESDYIFTFESPDDAFEPMNNFDGDFEYEYLGDGEFEMDPTFDLPAGDYVAKITAESPNGQKCTALVTLKVGLQPSLQATVNGQSSGIKVNEGGTLPVTFRLDGQTRNADSYAFLVPQDGCEAYVNTNMPPFSKGIRIPKNSFDPVDIPEIEFLDGTQSLHFKAVLSSKEDEVKKVTGYDEGDLYVTAVNVPPSVTYVTAAGLPVANGATLGKSVPKGVETSIAVGAWDVPADLDCAVEGKKFKTKVVVYDGTAATYEVEGNPEGQLIKHTFLNDTIGKEGTLVHVYVKDKDTSAYPTDPNWTFRVPVDDTPRVTLAYKGYDSGVWDETEANTHTMVVGLSVAAPVELELRVTVPVAGDDGYIKFKTNSRVTEEEPGSYLVKLPAGQTSQELYVSEMDGTADTWGGIEVNAAVITDTDSGYGKKWSEYYEPSNPLMPRVQNVAPEPSLPARHAPTNENFSAFKPFSVSYKLASDVPADIAAGITVVLAVDGNDLETVTGLTDKNKHEFATQVEFTTPGIHTVTVTFYDKDDQDYGTVCRAWYVVLPTKALEVRAHGPADSVSAPNGHSGRYGKIGGLGAGRIAFTQKPQSVKAWSYGMSASVTESSIPVTATGYSAGEIDSVIDSNGNYPKTSGADYDYSKQTDPGLAGLDSFFYAWVYDTTKASDGLEIETTALVAPAKSGTYMIPLQDYDKDKLSYDTQYWEAVFSREYLGTDNCGDINLDGIPDIYVTHHGWAGTFSSAFDANGVLTGNDLEKLSGFNGDGDYLPTPGTAGYSSLIPDTTGASNATFGVAFDAKTEIRGYGEGLNDAPALAGIGGVKPDKVYLNPDPTAKDYCPSSTLSKVEYLAWLDYKAAHPTATADDWSPERPTDPTTADTDEDGFTDGFEYYFWYMAHVGYMDGDVHRYLTGRRYDPKNPSEGSYISSAEIAGRMDPLVKYSGTDALTRDTDNDGLPDLLEFGLGTNPFDFDTDGDGLPDGWEVMISKTDPLKWATDDKTCDAMLNTDGDAMAFTTPTLEAGVSPKPFDIVAPIVFAVMDADGDSDGVQWYAVEKAPAVTAVTNETANAWGFRLVGDKRNYISYEKPVLTADGILAKTLAKGSGTKESAFRGAFVAGELSTVTNITEGEEESETNVFNYAACGFPVRIEAGTRVVASSVTSNVTAVVSRLAEAIPADAANACWTYGATGVGDGEDGGFGMLAIGRSQAVAKDAFVVSAPAADENVAYLHYLVYQQFGFDPRTAWNVKTPLASRWSTATAGKATRTRKYTAYDEFLVLSFFLNNGALSVANVTPTANGWRKVWEAYTTKPNLDVNGADTDGDGVPDGWELYVMSGPKKDGKYVFPEPYSNLSPFVGDAKKDSTDSKELSGDGDGLTEYQEFEGTDTMAYYADYSVTVKHDGEWKWFNKFFPTDPWNSDTDNDGLSDAKEEKPEFAYGTPADDGKLLSIPGGGLNPCSVDTDQDGLPDGWEVQFAKPAAERHIYEGEIISRVKVDGTEVGNPLEGLDNGMDGTVPDAYNIAPGWTVIMSDGRRWSGHIDRDYDHDGLDNWQEYLVGAMRCWRYDDPISRWTSIPTEYYFDEMGDFNPFRENGKYLALLGIDTSTEDGGVGEFWYRTLFDKESPAYNPRLVTDTCSGALYFSRVTNGFDPNYTDAGAYYIFYDRIGDTKYTDLWGGAPKKYISCSPLKADTDGDGMDDYYELFHGLNPILGADKSPVSFSAGCDIIFDAWGANDSTISALDNVWTRDPLGKRGRLPRTNDPTNNKFDFELFPWLNGLASADADGDDIRNQDEAIMPMLSPQSTWHHTDPSALWFTDSSYTNSLVSRFYRMPATYSSIVLPGKTFVFDGKTYSFSKADGYRVSGSAGQLAPLRVDQWDLTSDFSQNWMFSFEENEGYDTDHDGISDFEELQGKPTGTVSDPQYHDSPYRRQAMYFAGAENPSALQSMPFFAEEHPRYGSIYPDDMSFLQYTVECWVRPEEVVANKNYTILERAIWSSNSAAGDEELLRKNFQLAIRGGCWYTKFDANGTLKDSTVELQSTILATSGKWTHLAATYDGAILRLYVNGVEALKNGVSGRGLKPEYGSSAVIVHPGDDATKTNGLYLGRTDRYWWDREYPLHAFILGASAKNQTDLGGPTKRSNSHLNVVNGCGWGFYKDFFKGYIDEVRIWDGARKPDEIRADMTKRYTASDAKKNRTDFYDQWAQGRYRYSQDGNGNDQDVIAELRYHWSFDSLPGAENAEMAAKSAHGYGYVGPDGKTHAGSKAPLARPVGYEIGWWKTIVEGYAGTVYDNLAYVTWVPNTVTHLPRFDSTTLDSFYWAQDTEGAVNGSNPFVQTAEPVSRWVQYKRQGSLSKSTDFRTTSRRFWQANVNGVGNASQFFEFTGRHLNQIGDDLLPLGGAFVKYVDAMWDDQGASSSSEITGTDEDNNGLADWWQKYAAEHYSPEDEPMDWKTFVTYRGRRMTAGEAYLLDLARGYYADKDGNIVTDPDKAKQFANRADEDHDGLPDFWEKHYGIHTGDTVPVGTAHANEDPDNDGLSNYNEYLLSEVFDFAGLVFDPTEACSVDPFTPDYFYRVGELYVGEIFTDHDLVDDAWEDLYPASFASRLAWDAFNDTDQDGWSNRSENRYSKMVMPIVADQQAHHTAADGLVADYPIPTLALKLSYNGNRQDTVRTAPMAIQVTTDATLARDPDASYLIGATVDTTAGTGTTSKEGGSKSGASTETSLTRTIGKWSNRHAIGTLTPGNIKNNSLALQFCYDPSSVVYSWDVLIEHITGSQEWFTKRGTRTEYDADRRKYGEANVKLLSATSDYAELADLEMRSDDSSSVATWIHTKSGQTLGTVNLITGEFDLNLGVFKNQYVANGTNKNDYVSLEDQTFRIAYTANPSVGLPRELYLGEANTGHVKEGKNMIMAWAETVAVDGVWQPGEPYGIVRDVDVSWRGTKVEIELTDLSPVAPRIDLVEDTADRQTTRANVREQIEAHPDLNTPTILKWLDGNPIADRIAEGDSFRGQRVRVVRWMLNDVPVFIAGADAKVVLDKTIETDVRTCLTEADFLVGNDLFDIDWESFCEDAVLDGTVRSRVGNVTSAAYLVVIGDGDVDWNDFNTSNTVYALNTVIVRRFGENWVKPVAVAPGAVNEEIVHSANPTFKWTMDSPEEEGYTAFNVQVMDGTTLIYDSGKQLAPPRNIEGQYVWSAPLYVGDKTTLGKIFENKKVYTWKVSMYNAKFSNAANYSDPGKFFMEVQTNGTAYGTANVAVRYFGPTETYTRNNPVVRVQAFTSPDFTGKPVAAGYVADPSSAENGLAVANREVMANCHVVGLEPGSYYLQAFIDSNGNGVCDRWETQGYLCARDGSTADWLNPTTINFGTSVGLGDLAVIYLEDADTDADGLPDAWEYAVYGSLTAKGVELLTETKAGEQLYNKALTKGELALQDGAFLPIGGLEGLLGSRFLNNAGMVSLAMGAPNAGKGGFTEAIEAALAPDLAEGGVAITELGLRDGKVTVALDIVTTSGSESPLAKFFDASGKLTVVCEILWTPSLAQAPKVIYSESVVVGDAPVEFDISAALQKAQTEAGVDGASAFFSANVYKK